MLASKSAQPASTQVYPSNNSSAVREILAMLAFVGLSLFGGTAVVALILSQINWVATFAFVGQYGLTALLFGSIPGGAMLYFLKLRKTPAATASVEACEETAVLPVADLFSPAFQTAA